MLVERMWRAAMLQSSVYEEVEADEGATSQAALVVLIVAIAAVVGEFLSEALFGTRTGVAGLARGIVTGLFGDFVSWIVWSYVAYFVGTRLLGGTATPGELLRTLGFAGAPGVLQIFGFVPVLGGVINFVVLIWLLLTSIVAIRQALDFTTGKAIGTAIISLIPVVLVTLAADAIAERIVGAVIR
jgi:hypothetical protein